MEWIRQSFPPRFVQSMSLQARQLIQQLLSANTLQVDLESALADLNTFCYVILTDNPKEVYE